MSETSAEIVPQKSKGRSRITNGSAILPDADGRSVWCRRFRDLMASYVSDRGGESNVTEGVHALIRRVSVIEVELERWEEEFAANGGAADKQTIALYTEVANGQRRLLEKVGLERDARTVSPPRLLSEIMQEVEGPCRPAPQD
jgi:hypothetical protein